MVTTASVQPRWQSLAKVIRYLVFLLVVSSVGIELALRALSLAPTIGGFTVTETEFRRVPGIFSPNQSFVEIAIEQLAHQVTIDSLGYRGIDVPRAKPPNELRIVLAGDSFTFGSYVDDEQTLPATLEAALAHTCRSAVRTINAGIPSTTIRGQAEMLRRSVVLDPDLAVLVFHDNDFVNLLNGPIWDVFAENRRKKSRFPLSIIYPMIRSTAFWTATLEARRQWMSRGWVDESPETTSEQAEDSVSVEPYAEHLSALIESMKADGVPLLFVTYPRTSHPLESPEGPREGTLATEAAQALGVPTFDLYPTFWDSGLTPDELSLIPLDGHPSPAAHALAGQALAGAVRSLPEIQSSCDPMSDPEPQPPVG